jgi:hypothetical protein
MERHMTKPCIVLSGLLLLASSVRAGGGDPKELARRIDQRLMDRLNQAGVTPAPTIDDAAFLRRASLDLIGRIPTSHEVHAFLRDTTPDKRAKLIDKLLASSASVKHFTNVYRALMLPEVMSNFEIRYLQPMFDEWLRTKLAANTPYDKMAYELIAAPISASRQGQPVQMNGAGTPLPFYQAKDAKPENVAASVSRIFLGVQIECAQCHNHPFSKWSREQFWGMAAFFGGIERIQPNIYSPVREVLDRREMAIPNTDKVVLAVFLDDKEPEWKFNTSPRVTFAQWLTSPENPWFARAGANRIWAHLLGTGIIDPVDDLHDDNKPSHPELLDELAKAFIDSGFDTHFLLKAIAMTEAYQRSSAVTEPRQQDPRLFARMQVKGLTGEQLIESLSVATGVKAMDGNPYAFNPGGGGAVFSDKFSLPGKKTEPQTTVLQSLTLMNGGFVASATNVSQSTALGAIAEMPLMSNTEKIEALYIATLSRKPTAEELKIMLRHVERGSGKASEGVLEIFNRVYIEPEKAPKITRLGDVMWVLLNSAEFRLNH